MGTLGMPVDFPAAPTAGIERAEIDVGTKNEAGGVISGKPTCKARRQRRESSEATP